MYRFCIDIDNVIARTDEVMRRVITEFSDGKVRLQYEYIVSFNYYECKDGAECQISKSDWKKIHDRFSEPGTVLSIAPLPGAIEGLRRLAGRGILHLATTRLPSARKATLDWLEQQGVPEHNLHFLQPGEKHIVFKEFTAAVEDDYDQAVAFATLSRTRCFLLRHPWNKNRAKVEGIEWVNDWAVLTERLLAISQST